MKASEIIDLWNSDAPIVQEHLGRQASDIPKLHAKYYGLLVEAKAELRKARYLYKRMRAEKNEFIINPTQDAMKKYGWENYDRTILKSEIKDVLDGDEELLKIDMAVQEAIDKVELLQDVIKIIHGRNWMIKNVLEDRRFMEGG